MKEGEMGSSSEAEAMRATEQKMSIGPLRTIYRMAARASVSAADMFVDRGVFGLLPLQTHVVICGFPRSGSTLMQLMLASAMPNGKSFRGEVPALVAATRRFRNSSEMVTKKPSDIDAMNNIREYYARRKARPIFIVMLRDPRDVLTSVHGGFPDRYYVEVDRVVGIASSVLSLMDDPVPDTFVVRYEELVRDPTSIEALLASVLPLQTHLSEYLASGHDVDVSSQNALGSIRPVETSRIGRWRAPEHRMRIADVMRASPELPELIERLGY